MSIRHMNFKSAARILGVIHLDLDLLLDLFSIFTNSTLRLSESNEVIAYLTKGNHNM